MFLKRDQLPLLRESAAGGGGRWKLRPVFPLVLLWMFLHRNAVSVSVITSITTSCASGLGCPDSLFYRVAFVVEDSTLTMSQADVQEAMVIWFNQTFQNWTQSVYVDFISVQSGSSNSGVMSYQCQAFVAHNFTTNKNLGEAAKTQMSNSEAQLGTGLHIQTGSISFMLIGNGF